MKVFTLAPGEDWIVDRFVGEWNTDNPDLVEVDPEKADVIWLMADWCWRQLPQHVLIEKRVIATIHHIVPEKFGPAEVADFVARDRVVTAYHVPNDHTYNFIRPITCKPIHVIPYWANQRIWRTTGTKEELRSKHGLPASAYLIGSFQRDTEGRDLRSPKLEKGPDLLVDAIAEYTRRFVAMSIPGPEVVLAGWRRQYVMRRLDELSIAYHYFELPPQDTVNELYQTLDLYPVTARHEGGPQSLIECGLLGIPVVSRPIGIASQVLPPSAIHDDVTRAAPAVPRVEGLTLPEGYEPFRRMLESL